MPTDTLADRFYRTASFRAGHPAIVDGAVLTYTQLAARVTDIAGRLHAFGVQPGDTVALYFGRGSEGIAAMLGTWAAGAVAVPLVPDHPVDRVRRILSDARPRALLTDTAHRARASSLDDRGLAIIDTNAPMASVPEAPSPALTGESPALVLYTSGSTGTPKGVCHTHATTLQKIDRVRRGLGLTADDRFSWFSTYAVGQGVSASMLALLTGATLCPFDVRDQGVDRLARWLADEQISVYISSATLFRNLAASTPLAVALPRLRMIRIGGERVTPADVEAQRRQFPTSQLVVQYSATETGSISAHFIAPDEQFPDGLVPVGRPYDGIEVFIVNDDGHELPRGEEGEICVRSEYLFRGYADATIKGAVAAPADGTRPAKTYRTGDLGRIRADGLLEHCGRKDLRVKIRGFRIEIEEVETMIQRNPEVFRAAVAAKPDALGDLRLVAYVQPAEGHGLTVDSLRADLATRVPEHMLPSIFVLLDALPLTDSGKVARQQLPEPSSERPELSASFVAPRTATEQVIAKVWQDVLGLDAVGVHDAFLTLGGDSLKATQVASRLGAAFQADLPLHAFFEAETIAELATRLEPFR